MTIREAIRQGAALLQETSDTPALDSELLMAYALGTVGECAANDVKVAECREAVYRGNRTIDRGQVIARGNDDVDASTFFHYMELRQRGTPVAYITGHKEFYGLDFVVTPEVLIPKPDTETLVELAIDFVGHLDTILSKAVQIRVSKSLDDPDRDALNHRKATAIADICCGSGCVGISIAHECHVPVVFTDISQSALDICAKNARRLGVSGEFLCGNLLDVFPTGRKFGLIVSNPPYIPHADVEPLLSDGRGEPAGALDGGEDGLDVTRRLVSQAAGHLAPRGALMVESSEEGTAQVAEMMRQAGLADVQTYTDLGGLPRVATGRRVSPVMVTECRRSSTVAAVYRGDP